MTSTSTSAEGWHARATAHPDTSTFQPTADTLVFVSRLSTMTSPDSFTMALFLPDIAVDASGRVVKVQPQDFSILALLSEDVARFPDIGAFHGFWAVSSRFTCRANDYLHVRTAGGGMKTTGVYAWERRHTELGIPTAGYEHLRRRCTSSLGMREKLAQRRQRQRVKNGASWLGRSWPLCGGGPGPGPGPGENSLPD